MKKTKTEKKTNPGPPPSAAHGTRPARHAAFTPRRPRRSAGTMQNATEQGYLPPSDLSKEPVTKYLRVVLYKSYKIKILSPTFKYSNFSNSAVFHIFIPTEYFEDKVTKKFIKLDQNVLIFGSLYSCGLHIHIQTQMTRFLFQHIKKL